LKNNITLGLNLQHIYDHFLSKDPQWKIHKNNWLLSTFAGDIQFAVQPLLDLLLIGFHFETFPLTNLILTLSWFLFLC